MIHNFRMQFVALCGDARLPKNSSDDVGFDIYCTEDCEIPAGKVGKVKTGIALAKQIRYREGVTASPMDDAKDAAIPYLQFMGRSGLASKGVWPVGGVLDPSYRGELIALIYNSNDVPFTFKKGERPAQLVCYLVLANSEFIKVETSFVEKIEESARGISGFGASGK